MRKRKFNFRNAAPWASCLLFVTLLGTLGSMSSNTPASAQEDGPDPLPDNEACGIRWQDKSREPAQYNFVCQNGAAVLVVTNGSVISEKINTCTDEVLETKTSVLSYSVSGPTTEVDLDGSYDQYKLTPTRDGVSDGAVITVVAPKACDICPN